MGEKYAMKKWILFIAAILLLCSSIARADDFENGVKAYQEGNYDQAIELFRPLADQGDAGAQYNLGVTYDKGEGVIQDYKEVVKWYRLAAKKGDATAQYNLGLMYDNGRGVTQDYKEAAKWYRLAAKQGHASAQYNLGVTYAKGEGVTQNYVRTHMWLNLATSKGNKTAKKYLKIVAKEMSPSQIADAKKMARDCEKNNYKNCE